MPPAISHTPKHACQNFPICKRQQLRPWANGKHLPRLPFCGTCTASDRFCSHPDCTFPVVPAFKKDKTPSFCSILYADPAHASSRCWNLCNNAALGCRLLSTEMSRGSCHPCRAGEYPCKHAFAGCPLHVRGKDCSSKKRQYSCLNDGSSHGCAYDPSRKRRCSAPFCPELSSADRGSFCISCEDGRTPCPELCGRRSVPSNNGYCSLCRPSPGSSADTMRDPGIAASNMTSVSSRSCSTEKCSLPAFAASLCMHCASGLKPCRSPSRFHE